jgi:hypothetical protein
MSHLQLSDMTEEQYKKYVYSTGCRLPIQSLNNRWMDITDPRDYIYNKYQRISCGICISNFESDISQHAKLSRENAVCMVSDDIKSLGDNVISVDYQNNSYSEWEVVLKERIS